MKRLTLFFFPAIYAIVFGVLVSQGIFYFYDEETAGLLYFLSVALFSLLGGICLFLFGLLGAIDEGNDGLQMDIRGLEEKVNDVESLVELLAKHRDDNE